MVKTIILASNNKHKIEEIKAMLTNYDVKSLSDIGFTDDIIEDGDTFEANAIIKAEAVYNYIKNKSFYGYILADDSGLCVDALGGEPGVYSARYAGNHNDKANRDKLISALKGIKNRSAHYECDIALMHPDGTYKIFVGKCFGHITEKEIGENEFGYNKIFYSAELKKTFAQASIEERNFVSHRGKAIKQVIEYLSNKKD